jgi:hypothetical protein
MRRVMIDLVGVQGTDNAQLVGHATQMRKHFADFLAGLAPLLELEHWPQAIQTLTLQLGNRLPLGKRPWHRLAIHFCQLRFEVEALQMGRSTCHAEENDPFGSLWQVQWFDHTWPLCGKLIVAGGAFKIEQRTQRSRTNSDRGMVEKRTAAKSLAA